MTWQPTETGLATTWQVAIETELEAGSQAVLGMETGPGILEGVVPLLALQMLAERRTDPTRPLLMAGGTGPAWLAALFTPPHQKPPASPRVNVLFAGPDVATWLASHALSAGSRPRAFQPQPTAMTTAMHDWLFPHQAALPTGRRETLPWWIVNRPTAPPPDAPDPAQDWLAWISMVAVTLLLLLALVA